MRVLYIRGGMFGCNFQVSGGRVGGRAAREAGVVVIILAPPPSPFAHPLEHPLEPLRVFYSITINS